MEDRQQDIFPSADAINQMSLNYLAYMAEVVRRDYAPLLASGLTKDRCVCGSYLRVNLRICGLCAKRQLAQMVGEGLAERWQVACEQASRIWEAMELSLRNDWAKDQFLSDVTTNC